jgi:uncharacterized protein (TIGR02145 family)
MAENLNYAANNSKCYENDDNNCAKYGRLYTWNTAMNNSAFSNTDPSGVQGVCPSDWHLPSQKEYNTLFDYVQDNSNCSDCGFRLLKSTSLDWNDDSRNGTDQYGFSALPGGNCGSNGTFYSFGSGGYWWTTGNTVRLSILKDHSEWVGGIPQGGYYSVRCVKDEP